MSPVPGATPSTLRQSEETINAGCGFSQSGHGMMGIMRVTVCQLDTTPAGLPGAIAGLHDHIRGQNPDLVLLPELCFSSWLPATRNVDPRAWRESVRAHDAEIAAWLQLGVPALGTRPVEESGIRRNLAYTVDHGLIDRRAKYYLPDEPGYWEASWYAAGPKRFDVFRLGGVTIGVQICTEMWFLEWARHYARAGAEILCVPRATPYASVDRWIAGGRTAAVCSGAFCLSSNQWIPSGGPVDHGGVGWVIDPEGDLVGRTCDTNPFLTVEIDLNLAHAAKHTYPRYVAE